MIVILTTARGTGHTWPGWRRAALGAWWGGGAKLELGSFDPLLERFERLEVGSFDPWLERRLVLKTRYEKVELKMAFTRIAFKLTFKLVLSLYGAARCATVHAVRVFDCDGWGTTGHVLRGLDWVREQVARPEMRPAVVTMSIGGGFSPAINDAVDRIHAEGDVAVVVSAGEELLTSDCHLTESSERRCRLVDGGS